MRITKLLFAAVFSLFLSVSAFATNGPEVIELREEMKTFIEKANIDVQNDERIIINFLVNSQNEIVIVSTSKNIASKQVRNALNHRTVSANDFEHNKIYTLPIQLRRI